VWVCVGVCVCIEEHMKVAGVRRHE
jgi:hypothetical protein